MTSSFEIIPYVGVSRIRFGMTVEQTRALINISPESFNRTPTSVYPLDYFKPIGVFVIYDGDGKVEAVEFTVDASVTYKNDSIQGFTESDVKTFFSRYSPIPPKIDSDSIISYELGIGFWLPDLNEQDNCIAQSIIAFRRGYYDK